MSIQVDAKNATLDESLQTINFSDPFEQTNNSIQKIRNLEFLEPTPSEQNILSTEIKFITENNENNAQVSEFSLMDNQAEQEQKQETWNFENCNRQNLNQRNKKNNQKKVKKMTLNFHARQVQQNLGFLYIDKAEGFDAFAEAQISKAEKHRKAKKIQKSDKSNDNQNEKCDCCGNIVNGQKYSLCCEVSELADLGEGFTLYFIFMKYLTYILGISFFTIGLAMCLYC